MVDFKIRFCLAAIIFSNFLLAIDGGCDYAKKNRNKMFLGRPETGFLPKPKINDNRQMLDANAITSGWFTQKLDHFDTSSAATWLQLYQKNDNYYKPGGPMFVMIGGEGAIDVNWMTYGQWYKNAQIFGALMFQLEHRFYGSSHPTNDTSTENLKYLSSEQALADLDYFIAAMANTYGAKKTIVFGGSYAEYLETVGNVMDYFYPNCSKLVHQGFSSIGLLVANHSEYLLYDLFEPCPPALNFQDSYDIATFYNSLITPWMYAVQYTPPDAASSDVHLLCNIMSNSSYGGTVLERLSYFSYHFDCCTFHEYKGQIMLLKQFDWKDYWVKSGTRQWTWQTCNEFGYYQSTDSQSQPFGDSVPLTYIEDTSCTQIFGQSFDRINSNANSTNSYYGGTKGTEKRTFFVNGSLDPWHNLAVYKLPAPDSSDVIAFVNGTSHCYDMGDDLPTDPAQLTEVRSQITEQIAKWLTS